MATHFCQATGSRRGRGDGPPVGTDLRAVFLASFLPSFLPSFSTMSNFLSSLLQSPGASLLIDTARSCPGLRNVGRWLEPAKVKVNDRTPAEPQTRAKLQSPHQESGMCYCGFITTGDGALRPNVNTNYPALLLCCVFLSPPQRKSNPDLLLRPPSCDSTCSRLVQVTQFALPFCRCCWTANAAGLEKGGRSWSQGGTQRAASHTSRETQLLGWQPSTPSNQNSK